MRKSFAFIIAASFLMSGFAQKPSEVINWNREHLPSQHIYVHFDKQAYVAGDTAWFKAYLYSNYAPSTASTNFFIELIDEKGNHISSKRLPVFEGTALGNFDLPANLREAVYVVRAYTKWSANIGPSFIFKKALPVFNPAMPLTMAASTKINFEFFPEGGSLVSGLPNNIAFRVKDERSVPVKIIADLMDSKNNKIGNFAKDQSEGIFSFTPLPKEKYYAAIKLADGRTMQYDLPAALEKGIVLTVADEENGKSFSAIASPGLMKEGDQVELIGVIDQHVVLDTKVPVNNNEALGLIATKNLYPGVMHIFLFDNQNKLLAQRTTIIRNEKLSLPVELKIDELGKGPKAKNVFNFSFPDNLSGSFSVSVTDADRELSADSSEDMYSGLLIQSGSLKYLPRTKMATEEEADLLAVSNKWSGDNWQLLMKKAQPPHFTDKYISVIGRNTTEDGSATVIDGNMNLILQPKNFMQKEYVVNFGSNGIFHLDSLIFEDSARIYYELIANKKNKKGPGVSLMLKEPEFDFNPLLKNMDLGLTKTKEFILADRRSIGLATEQQNNLEATRQMTAKIKAVKKDKHSDSREVAKRYVSGLFASASSKTFDFITDPPPHGGINVFDYLQGLVSGLIIEKVNTGYNLWSSRSVSTNEVLRGNRRGLVPGKVYLNEIESSSDAVLRIPLDQIAMVKYYDPGSIMLPGIGASPILAVWTKHAEDMGTAVSNDMNYVMHNGYSPVRKFYSPDYSTTSKNTPDNRITLYWDPNISVVEDKQFSISFYNSDAVKRFHVVLEGFTSEGKLVRLNKIVEVVKAF
jgi:hypothetical protein